MVAEAVLRRFKAKLWDWGHDCNPDTADLEADRYSRTEFINLPMESNDVVMATYSYQQYFKEGIDEISDRMVGKSITADGEINPHGSATVMHTYADRCQCPEFYDPRAPSPAGDPNAATGSGSWPAGCKDEYPENHVIKVAVDLDGVDHIPIPEHWSRDWDWITGKCIDAYAEMGLGVIYIPWADRDYADVHAYFTNNMPGRGTIGYAAFNNGTCSDTVWHRLRPSYRADRDLLANLHIHELGHNCNFQHTPRGIMAPVNNRTSLSYVGDPSWRTGERFFGGEEFRVSPTPGPGPEPTPPLISVDIKGMINGRKYRLVPVDPPDRPPITV